MNQTYFQLMRHANRRPLLLHLFPHHDITVCNKVLMSKSSRGHAVKLTIWRSLADFPRLARLHTALWWNNNKYSASQLHRGGGVWVQIQLWSLFWLHCNSEAQSWLPANNWLYWELTLPTPSCCCSSLRNRETLQSISVPIQIQSARLYLTAGSIQG